VVEKVPEASGLPADVSQPPEGASIDDLLAAAKQADLQADGKSWTIMKNAIHNPTPRKSKKSKQN
jgi:hypothetical protein